MSGKYKVTCDLYTIPYDDKDSVLYAPLTGFAGIVNQDVLNLISSIEQLGEASLKPPQRAARDFLVKKGIVNGNGEVNPVKAKPETFAGLSGIGDLMVTCMSRHSRNRGVGERLGKGETLEQIMSSMKMVAEGVWNCQAAKELADELGVPVPITEQVNAVVHEGKDPRKAVMDLMARVPKPERE